MKNVPNHVWLFLIFVILLAAYIFAGKDPTVHDMMLAVFAAALAVMRPPDPANPALPVTLSAEVSPPTPQAGMIPAPSK